MVFMVLPQLVKTFIGLASLSAASLADAASVELTPISGGDGAVEQVEVKGGRVWQNTGTAGFMYFQKPANFTVKEGQTLYVGVTYLDEGSGRITMQYDSTAGPYSAPTVHSRTSRVGSGEIVNGYFELPSVMFANRENNKADFRINGGAPGGVKISISKVTLSDTPGNDANFLQATSKVWKSRYSGPGKTADATTLKGKVMAGYQGWFRTPNDLDDGGWGHWLRGVPASENFCIDMWPDVSAYAPESRVRAGDLMTQSGKPAHLFSSTSLDVVKTHFKWMREHDIDGAFLQRFGPAAGKRPEWVLRNVTEAAAQEGRIWAIEYDVSGMADATVLEKLKADWEWLTKEFKILEDPRYAHEKGKPVVFVWGLPVPDRNFTPANANAVVDYFKAQGTYVIGSLLDNWRTMNADWQEHAKTYDGILIWQNQHPADMAIFTSRGQDFYPHTWPGFSWAHLKKLDPNNDRSFSPRKGGETYWKRTKSWIDAGADRMFVGMFDEYDESTAIMPMTDDHPAAHSPYGRFVNNEGRPADWWLRLTAHLKKMMLKQIPASTPMPER